LPVGDTAHVVHHAAAFCSLHQLLPASSHATSASCLAESWIFSPVSDSMGLHSLREQQDCLTVGKPENPEEFQHLKKTVLSCVFFACF
jgi:hypothetical protein